MQAFCFYVYIALMNEDDENLLSAFRLFEQLGGNPLSQAKVTPVGRNRSFRGIVDQKKYKLTLQQLRDAQNEPLGEAITEALIQGLQRVVENEGSPLWNGWVEEERTGAKKPILAAMSGRNWPRKRGVLWPSIHPGPLWRGWTNGSQYQNLRKEGPIQERLAKLLHREAGVPEAPSGFEEMEKFKDFLGPQGYQLIVVEPSTCLIVFKEAKYNNTPHAIWLVKHQDHFDGLTSIPALINPSYYCCLNNKGYDFEGATHHNCCGQNCPACLRTNKICPNYAAWIKPTLECPNCNCKFYGQDCFEAHKKKGKKKDDKSICDLIPPNCISVTM